MTRRAGGPNKVVLAGLVAVGVLLWRAPSATGQGVPPWAPKVVHIPDANGVDASVGYYVAPYRDPDGGNFWPIYKETIEFLLGFDPLEPTYEEEQRKALRDGGADASVVAVGDGGPADGAVAVDLDGGPAVAPDGSASDGAAVDGKAGDAGASTDAATQSDAAG